MMNDTKKIAFTFLLLWIEYQLIEFLKEGNKINIFYVYTFTHSVWRGSISRVSYKLTTDEKNVLPFLIYNSLKLKNPLIRFWHTRTYVDDTWTCYAQAKLMCTLRMFKEIDGRACVCVRMRTETSIYRRFFKIKFSLFLRLSKHWTYFTDAFSVWFLLLQLKFNLFYFILVSWRM